MGTFPNIPKGDTIKAQALGSRGGKMGTDSLAKRYAAQIREMKKKGSGDEQIAFFVKRLEDPTASVLHIQKLLDDFLATNPRENNKVQAMEKLIQLHRANFGDKHHNVNVNINVDLDVKDVDEHLNKVIDL